MFAPVWSTAPLSCWPRFYFIDSRFFKQESIAEYLWHNRARKIAIFGRWNFLLLSGVVGAVLMSGLWKPEHRDLKSSGSRLRPAKPRRDVILIALTARIYGSHAQTSPRRQQIQRWTHRPEAGRALPRHLQHHAFPSTGIRKAGRKT